MLRSLFRALLPQAAKTAKPVSHGVKCIDASQLKQVAGGAPKGGVAHARAGLDERRPQGRLVNSPHQASGAPAFLARRQGLASACAAAAARGRGCSG